MATETDSFKLANFMLNMVSMCVRRVFLDPDKKIVHGYERPCEQKRREEKVKGKKIKQYDERREKK